MGRGVFAKSGRGVALWRDMRSASSIGAEGEPVTGVPRGGFARSAGNVGIAALL